MRLINLSIFDTKNFASINLPASQRESLARVGLTLQASAELLLLRPELNSILADRFVGTWHRKGNWIMYRGIGLAVWIGLLMLTGCFNRPGTSPFGTNARVSAPGTYNLRIPSMANNQPYYAPDQRQQAAAVPGITPPAAQVNPNAPAPTVVADNRNVNGWNLINGVSNQASNAPVYQSPYAVPLNRGVPGSNLQVAVASTIQNSGLTNSNNTFANQVNPNVDQIRGDSTRMAAIDVSGVRAPMAGAMQNNPALSAPGQLAATGPQQYFGQFQSGRAINPPANNNGFVQPMPNRLAAQPAPGTYQSPYIRSTGAFGPGVGQRAGNPGWVARDEEQPANR